MKKNLFVIFYSTVLLINCRFVLAQEVQIIPKPIADFIAAPQPDILKEKLAQAKNQVPVENDTLAQPAVEKVSSNPQSTNDEFINPFIPQIPQTVKTTAFVNPQVTSTPDMTVETIPIPEFIVAGIIWNSKKPQAIVNQEIVTIGDNVNNWKVSEITKDGVRMNFEEQNLWVKPIINPEAQTQAQTADPYRR